MVIIYAPRLDLYVIMHMQSLDLSICGYDNNLISYKLSNTQNTLFSFTVSGPAAEMNSEEQQQGLQMLVRHP